MYQTVIQVVISNFDGRSEYIGETREVTAAYITLDGYKAPGEKEKHPVVAYGPYRAIY